MKYAHGIVSEYLSEDLAKKLAQHLNLVDETDIKKRKLSSPKENTDDKRSKKDTTENESILKPKAPDSFKSEKVTFFLCA